MINHGACISILLLSCTFYFACDKGFDPGGGPSEKVVKFLGNEIIGLLKDPDRVESFRIGLMKDPKAKDNLAGYPILFRGREMAPKQMEILRSIFLDEDTYLFDVVKKCLFLPEYAFRVTKNGEVLVILICYNCEEVVFVYKDKELLEDFDNATPRIKLLTSGLVD